MRMDRVKSLALVEEVIKGSQLGGTNLNHVATLTEVLADIVFDLVDIDVTVKDGDENYYLLANLAKAAALCIAWMEQLEVSVHDDYDDSET